MQQQQSYESSIENSQNSYDFEYIPAPRWNKAQNSILEELFKKSRYPKPAELKSFAQRLHVMDTDVEVIDLFSNLFSISFSLLIFYMYVFEGMVSQTTRTRQKNQTKK